MANVMSIVKNMIAGTIGGVLVGSFVTAANYSGTVAIIAGLLTTVLLAGIMMKSLDTF